MDHDHSLLGIERHGQSDNAVGPTSIRVRGQFLAWCLRP